MSRNIHIRDLSEEDLDWINSAKPPGVTQNEFLRSILVDARKATRQPGLFDYVVQPKTIYASIPFKFIDLFAGIGGFRSAMTALGGNCVFTNEWDKYACKTYQAWYGDEEVHAGDIGEIDIEAEIPDHDVLCAGFPCQPFSLAGVSKKASLGRSHGFECETQGNLFFRIMDIVDAKRPPVLFLENVKNLRSHDKGNTWRIIEQNIVDRDYAIFSNIIDARRWVPQHRERIFIVCFDKKVFGREYEVGFTFPDLPEDANPTLGDILHRRAPDKKYMLSDKLWNYLQDYAEKHRKKGNGFGYGLFGKDDVARTLSARYHKDGSEVLIRQSRWKNPRRLTPSEAKMLMGFDDRYARMFGHQSGFPQVVSDTQAYRQFGNAVVPKVVEAIGKHVVHVMAKTALKSDTECLLKGRQIVAA
ncbi:MAG: DNA (cytosine-5-)-methyltransferase [Gammaproteobacteria bacterium]|nr:DNA (cytosine-5-)-methyltransferase [Gammaproteobacteria bacterium]